MSLKNPVKTTGNRSRDRPTSSAGDRVLNMNDKQRTEEEGGCWKEALSWNLTQKRNELLQIRYIYGIKRLYYIECLKEHSSYMFRLTLSHLQAVN